MKRNDIVEIRTWEEYLKLSLADKRRVQVLFGYDEEAIKEFLESDSERVIGLF